MLLLAGILFLPACKGGKKLTKPGKLPPARSNEYLLKQADKGHVDYEWFAAKAKMHFKGPEQEIQFIASVRMRKDSIIWLQFSKLGIEGARVRITPNKVEILDRQDGAYISRPFSFLWRAYGISANFSELQSLIVGNMPRYDERTICSPDSGCYLLRGADGGYTYAYRLDVEQFLPMVISLATRDGSFVMSLSEYLSVGTEAVAHSRLVEVNSPEGKANVDIHFTKIEIDVPQKLGFDIPESYKRY